MLHLSVPFTDLCPERLRTHSDLRNLGGTSGSSGSRVGSSGQAEARFGASHKAPAFVTELGRPALARPGQDHVLWGGLPLTEEALGGMTALVGEILLCIPGVGTSICPCQQIFLN